MILCENHDWMTSWFDADPLYLLPLFRRVIYFSTPIRKKSTDTKRREDEETIVHYGSLKIEKLLKSFFWVKSAGIKKQKLGSVILTCFVSLICAGNFWRELDANLAPFFSRHSFRAIWPGQRKSCVRDVTCLSLPSMAEGMPAFRHAV